MIYMFNELSLKKVDSREKACSILENFVKSYIGVKEIGFDEIRLHENSLDNLFSISLHDEYNVDLWLIDNRINSDLQNRFREIVTSFPLIKENEVTENEYYDRSEFSKELNNVVHRVWGLGAAFIHDTLAISFETDEEWLKSEIIISHYFLDHYAEEKNINVVVKHFSNLENLNNHLDWWEALQLKSLQSSEDLWNKRKEFFPSLVLSEDVRNQLQRIGVSKTLSQIIERLRALDEYAKEWKDGNFNYEDVNQTTNLRISPESNTTLRKFGSQRKFHIPDQGKKLCDLHIKTGDLRFHFYPDNFKKIIYIGYIGKHLRIASED